MNGDRNPRRFPAARSQPTLDFAPAAELHFHQAVDVGLLRFDLLAEVRHHAAEFGDHGVGVGQLPAEAIDVVGRRHAGLNTAPRSG